MRKNVRYLTLSVGYSIIAIAILLCKNLIIINFNLHVYKFFRTAAGFLIAFATISLILAILASFEVFPFKNEEDTMLNKVTRDKEAKRLANQLAGKWHILHGKKRIIIQLSEVLQYRTNLTELLSSNNTELGMNPVEIMEKVENCMYTNIKKLLNYMHALNPADKDFVQEKLNVCTSVNEEVLRKARDFSIAVVDYINRDMDVEENRKALSHIESYKKVVLDALDDSATYLS